MRHAVFPVSFVGALVPFSSSCVVNPCHRLYVGLCVSPILETSPTDALRRRVHVSAMLGLLVCMYGNQN